METSATALSEAHGHLERIRRGLGEGHKALYHDLALYLQVLRDGLGDAVQQAVFHVATQVVPERYQQLNDRQRQELPRRLAQLVQRCGCLLTLEQLLVLARQVQGEQRRQGQQDQRRLAEALAQMAGGSEDDDDEEEEEREEAEGSIRLDLTLPLSAELFSAGLPSLAGLSGLVESTLESTLDSSLDPSEDLLAGDMPIHGDGDREDPDDGDDGDLADDDAGEEEPQGEGAESEDPTDILRALLVMAVPPERRAASRGPGQLFAEDTSEPLPAECDDADGHQGLVPQQPLELLEWWQALDRALQRRLRNLSHAINLDLIKLGLARSLLPLSLLDAVLQGDLDALPAPANLLRIQLPFGSPDTPVQVQALGVLLRTSDLEYEQPRLRTCRKRLEQRRASVRKMAQQYRHWQRRVLALEAEQQWMQDSQSTPEGTA